MTGKNTKKWTVGFLLSSLVLLMIVVAINFIYDPGEVYYKKIRKEKYLDAYVNTLVQSKVGLPFFSNERQVKYKLAQLSTRQSYVMGSSRSMDFSSYRASSLRDVAGDITNLGVSGGSFEDLVIYSGLLLDKPNAKNVYFVLDPWTLKFNMDSTWQQLEKDYTHYAGIFGFTSQSTNISHVNKYKNLLNFHYLSRSVETMSKEKLTVFSNTAYTRTLEEVNDFDFDKGLKTPVTLNDGSHVYDEAFIKNPPVFDGAYKISDQYADPNTIEAFGKIVKALNNKGIKTFIVMVPYNPLVFLETHQPAIKEHIRYEEQLIIKTAKKLGISYFGSFDPINIGCEQNDFHDDKHPKLSCLNKINFKNANDKVTDKIIEIHMDEKLDWTYDSSAQGIVYVKVPYDKLHQKPGSSPLLQEKMATMEKLNGMKLSHIKSNSWQNGVADEFYFSGKEIIISISNNDSGWDNGHRPTNEEIKNHFLKNPYTATYMLELE
ncbi:hypothetical protein [Paenibacillus alginolyticus]|uniref:Uncharacterized protein n=1 Tax=Paenibacillus alginolyticus TaxID=59839 RepID=A0ABT4G8S7_9BACL|nr:hypothetical protein [Paenibacillus alginolyticus]MCY9692573.1 hypothetical protein [Paenibacillus alginolyticus]MEC0143779.1 hypothetical protein [Paenibacillus alginolyticus]